MATIVFLSVSNNLTKIQAICETIRQQFLSGKAIVIAVQNDEAAKYIDQLLWRMPEESFLPHVIADRASTERIVITKNKGNLNNASVCFNLSPEPYPGSSAFEFIFELMDLTQPEKQKLSEQRLSAYRGQGHEIVEKSYVYSP